VVSGKNNLCQRALHLRAITSRPPSDTLQDACDADTRLQTRAVHARLLKARVNTRLRLLKARVNTRLQTVLHRVVAVGKMSLVRIILVLHFRFRWRLALVTGAGE
jgi:hypothetical protein